ncbi:pentapeptide repeat-containing protein [Streptomyces sp. NRRL S-1022]|uniref:pentapeptide repeat-containing protein n=1 Tax=Streptomyces sp. NRRL S-1022 TaxID=1463880 RepID=UPI0022772F16|nr:pentapeptide repeat-containing protein [Streptomyces sp. NRRL S-1022]
MNDCRLVGANLDGADLSGADLTGAELDADFRRSAVISDYLTIWPGERSPS